jgi:hypothetical protein
MSQVKVYYCDKNDLCEELTTSCGAIHAVVLASDYDKLEAKLKIAIDALEEIITHVGAHHDGLDGRFVETKSTVRALNALEALKQLEEK